MGVMRLISDSRFKLWSVARKIQYVIARGRAGVCFSCVVNSRWLIGTWKDAWELRLDAYFLLGICSRVILGPPTTSVVYVKTASHFLKLVSKTRWIYR